MSYWQEGDPVRDVQLEGTLPICFTWQGRVHTVSTIAKVWRIDDAWWQRRVWQDRFKLVTTTGLLVILAHDLLADTWHLLRIYD